MLKLHVINRYGMLAALLWLIPACLVTGCMTKVSLYRLHKPNIASTEPLIYGIRVAPDSTAPDASAPKVVYVLRGMDSKPDRICWIVVV